VGVFVSTLKQIDFKLKESGDFFKKI